jgi:hypothetical protein
MKKKERIRILEQDVERLKIQYATLLAEVNRLRWPQPIVNPPPYTPSWPDRVLEVWCQSSSIDTIADEARSDA